VGEGRPRSVHDSSEEEIPVHKLEIILIGPIGSGKSTLGKLIAEKLGLPQCSMDDHRWRYYDEIGYDREKAKTIGDEEGFLGVYRYWKPFEVYAVERLLSGHSGCVIDLGAGHSVYEDGELFERARRVLEPYDNVVLVLPSPDPNESIRELRERNNKNLGREFDLNAHFVTHHSNYDLAKHVVYTAGKEPEETRDEILSLVRLDEPFKRSSGCS
jgi:shikimate kinase